MAGDGGQERRVAHRLGRGGHGDDGLGQEHRALLQDERACSLLHLHAMLELLCASTMVLWPRRTVLLLRARAAPALREDGGHA
eukprot:424101-Rhodomonas_salina.1